MKIHLPAPVVRISLALAFSAVLFQSGREVGRLEGLSEGPKAGRHDVGNEIVSATYRGAPEPAPVEAKPAVTVGDPVGKEPDVITPLNVRDPSALVMGPGASSFNSCPPVPAPLPPDVEPARPAKARKIKPLAEGRLLELLKKKESPKELDVPKSY